MIIHIVSSKIVRYGITPLELFMRFTMKNLRFSINIFAAGLIFFAIPSKAMQQGGSTSLQMVKKLQADDPQSKYDGVIASLKRNKLTVGLAIEQLLNEKRNKAIAALRTEWKISNEEWNHVQQLKEKVEESDKQHYGTPESRKIMYEDDAQNLPQKVKNEIKRIFVENDIKTNLCVGQCGGTFGGADRKPFKKFNTQGKQICYEMEPEATNILILGDTFLDLIEHEQRATLEHEISGHMKKYHQVEHALIRLIVLSHKCLLSNIIFKYLPEEFTSSPAYTKFCRYQEAEADRLPAAIRNTSVAWDMELHFRNFPGVEEFALQKGHYLIPDIEHPSSSKRIAWATKIRRLREAEERAGSWMTTLKNIPQDNPKVIGAGIGTVIGLAINAYLYT